jgi:hypothetical protein
MDPQSQFCHNPACPARGQRGRGNIHVHSRRERRDRCTTCGRTFAATQDPPFYRLLPAFGDDSRADSLIYHGERQRSYDFPLSQGCPYAAHTRP